MKNVRFLSTLRRKLNLRRVLIDGCMIALVVALGFAAKPAYRVFCGIGLTEPSKRRKRPARIEDWTTARDKARSVLLVRRNDFDAFRIWSRACSRLGEPRAILPPPNS